jgi:hypothetical protein
MTNHRYEYDAALSFAQEDEAVARKLGEALASKDIRVLYDEAEAAQLGGGNFVTHIAELFRTRAQYCLLLISQHYPLKHWTEAERTSTQQHALRDAAKYILPIQLEDNNLPQQSVESIADELQRKLRSSKPQSGPPEESHDLRSGNVPAASDEPDD